MATIHLRITLAVLLAVSFTALQGCGEGKYKPPTIEAGELTGEWIQVDIKRPKTGRMKQGESDGPSFQRHLVINSDNTFVFSLRDESGNPYKENLQADGTWAINAEDNTIVFTVNNSTFKDGDDGADWTPKLGINLRDEPIRQGQMELLLTIEESSGYAGKYKRAS